MPISNSDRLHDFEEVRAFVDLIRNIHRHPHPAVRTLFHAEPPLAIARAPGRLDVMGGIADYSGALVLQWPLREATLVAVQPAKTQRIRICSLGAEDNQRSLDFCMPLEAFGWPHAPVSYETARAFFSASPLTKWAGYVAGCILVLSRECRCSFDKGFNVLVSSDVPEGKGVSSSAALEVATMQALNISLGLGLNAKQVALLAEKVENQVVGAPCGIMDQMTSSCGRANKLLALHCQPAEIQGFVDLPPSLGLWGIDSGVRHAVSGSDYDTVRVGTFMGYRLLEYARGTQTMRTAPGRIRLIAPVWNHHLANVSRAEYDSGIFPGGLPQEMTGQQFLAQYQGIHDTITTIAPDRCYQIRVPTEHAIFENDRVERFVRLLRPGLTFEDKITLGALMYQSHASYSACGLGSDATDHIVEIVRSFGPARGLYGAKITGGGSGGTVAILADAGAGEAIDAVVQACAAWMGATPYVFSGSSPGAGSFGTLTLSMDHNATT